jgi:diguanylate cyclase (GGDEF)-like protein
MAPFIRPPGTILLDARLPGASTGELLAEIYQSAASASPSIALITDDEVAAESSTQWLQRLHEGILADIVPRNADPLEWATHLNTLHRIHSLESELEALRESALRQVQIDRLTGTFNRESMLSVLFRETDRVQRLRGSLCLVLIDLDDFGHWNTELGLEACDDLLRQVAVRVARLLRSYDLLGRISKDEFLLALPGCSTVDAVMLAERLRMDIFGEPFQQGDSRIRLSACFGISSSRGRSPVVVLREAEKTLELAKLSGPDSIRCASEKPLTTHNSVQAISQFGILDDSAGTDLNRIGSILE